MNDETTETVDPEADVEAEEGEAEAPPPAALDSAAIFAEAQTRYDAMKEKGRADADSTYAGFVVGLKSQSDAAVSAALRAEADRRTADSQMKKGPYNRRRLAVQVASGAYDAA